MNQENKQLEELAKDMDRAIRCLALELPESVWLHVIKTWQDFKAEFTANLSKNMRWVKASDRLPERPNDYGECQTVLARNIKTNTRKVLWYGPKEGSNSLLKKYPNDYEWLDEAGFLAASSKTGSQPSGMQWVKASERLPEGKGKENSVIIKNDDPNHFFVSTGFVNFSKDHPAIYFELGPMSYLTTHDKGNGHTTFPIENIFWLDESTQQGERRFTLDEIKDAWLDGWWQCEEGRDKSEKIKQYFKEKFNIYI